MHLSTNCRCLLACDTERSFSAFSVYIFTAVLVYKYEHKLQILKEAQEYSVRSRKQGQTCRNAFLYNVAVCMYPRQQTLISCGLALQSIRVSLLIRNKYSVCQWLRPEISITNKKNAVKNKQHYNSHCGLTVVLSRSRSLKSTV